MRKLILTILLLSCTLAGVLWAGRAIADNPPAGEPAAELPKTKTNEIDGAELVLIPAGEFLMGTSEEELAAWLKAHPDDKREWFANEMPQRKVYLDAYYMYKTEVTVAQYRKFCQATGRAMPPEPDWKWQDTHPIVNVTWDEAQAYATWAGASLPTEAQWEKAARGGDRRVFPWGDAWPPPQGAGNFADISAKRQFPHWTIIEGYDDGYVYTSPVGAFAANPYGLHDLAGNVWEWCADWYDDGYYKNAPAQNPTGPTETQATLVDLLVMKDGRVVREKGKARVLRGGSWYYNPPGDFRAAFRSGVHPTLRNYILGFRCVAFSPGQ